MAHHGLTWKLRRGESFEKQSQWLLAVAMGHVRGAGSGKGVVTRGRQLRLLSRVTFLIIISIIFESPAFFSLRATLFWTARAVAPSSKKGNELVLHRSKKNIETGILGHVWCGDIVINTTAPHISPRDTGGMFSSTVLK